MSGPIDVLGSIAHSSGSVKVLSYSHFQYSDLQKIYKNVKTFRAGVAVLNKQDKKLLLVHQSASDLWGVPKGHRDLGETTAVQTAIRELREETGLVISDDKFSEGVIAIDLKYVDGVDVHVYFVLPVDRLPEIRTDGVELWSHSWHTINGTKIDRIKQSRPTMLLIGQLRKGMPRGTKGSIQL